MPGGYDIADLSGAWIVRLAKKAAKPNGGRFAGCFIVAVESIVSKNREILQKIFRSSFAWIQLVDCFFADRRKGNS